MKSSQRAPATKPAGNEAPAFTHNINALILEVTIAQELKSHGDWSTAFAIHNKYIGDAPPRAIPVNLSFNGRSHKRAVKVLHVGTRLVIHGALHFSEGETKAFYSVQVDNFTLCGQPADKSQSEE